MDKNVTVSVRGLLITGVVLAVVVVAYLVGQAGGSTAQAADPSATPGDPTEHTLTLRGTGKVTAVPDQVTFDVNVGVTRHDLTTALDDANTTLDTVLGTLADHGVAKEDVETTGLDMNPVYHYESKQPPRLTGYRVSEQVAVLVKDLKGAGGAIAAVVDAGGRAVRVSDIGLKVGDTDKVLADARAAAVADAKAKADEYAAAAGQPLGAVVSLTEVSPQSVVSQVRAFANAAIPVPTAADAVSAVPIRAGHSDVQVTVQMVWQLP